MHQYIFASLLAAMAFSVAASENADRLAKLEAAMDKIAAQSIVPGGPGCSVAIMQNQQFLFKKSYGMAHVEHQVPQSDTSVFRMASVSKQFTAMAVLLLADDGRISLDDDIRTYIPDLPDYGAKVSINAMLGHFSGMANNPHLFTLLPKPLESIAGGEFRWGDEDYLTGKEFIETIKTLPLAYEPNKEQRYSNFAYDLLAVLVEKASGMTLREFADQRIFKPLGMNQTYFADDMREVVPHRAEGYRTFDLEEIKGLKRYEPNIFVVGSGGLHTSINDMFIWDKQFYAPKLGKDPQAFLAKMNTPNGHYPDVDEGKWFYANGQYTDGRYFFHNGSEAGTDTSYIRRPDTHTSVVAMCNSSSLNANAFSYQTFQILQDIGLWEGEDPSVY